MLDIQLVNVSQHSIKDFISIAKHRIFYVKPAFLNWEIEEILTTIEKSNISPCEIYLESGDESIRFGFGDKNALNLISQNLDKFTVKMVSRIKISILIVDNNCLIFSPSLAQLEDGKGQLNFPSGIYGNKNLVEKILLDFPSYTFQIPIKVDDISNPFDETINIEILYQEDVTKQLNVTVSNLEEYPPVDPVKLKKIHYYRNNFKILKRQLVGLKIKNKKLNLNSFIKLFDSKNDRLLRSWNILSHEDIKHFQDMSYFEKELQFLDDELLLDIGRFGALIRTKFIKEYETKIKALKEDFMNFMNGVYEEENRFFKYRDNNNETFISLEDVLNNSRKELIQYLESIAKNDEKFFNRILEENRYLNRNLNNGSMKKDEVCKHFITNFVDNKLKFPNEEELLGKIDIRLDFYDISDELINSNKDFNKYMENYRLNDLRRYEEGYVTTY